MEDTTEIDKEKIERNVMLFIGFVFGFGLWKLVGTPTMNWMFDWSFGWDLAVALFCGFAGAGTFLKQTEESQARKQLKEINETLKKGKN